MSTDVQEQGRIDAALRTEIEIIVEGYELILAMEPSIPLDPTLVIQRLRAALEATP